MNKLFEQDPWTRGPVDPCWECARWQLHSHPHSTGGKDSHVTNHSHHEQEKYVVCFGMVRSGGIATWEDAAAADGGWMGGDWEGGLVWAGRDGGWGMGGGVTRGDRGREGKEGGEEHSADKEEEETAD